MTVPEALSPLHTVTGTMLRGRKETARKSHFFYWSPIFSHFELARGPIFLGSSKINLTSAGYPPLQFWILREVLREHFLGPKHDTKELAVPRIRQRDVRNRRVACTHLFTMLYSQML